MPVYLPLLLRAWRVTSLRAHYLSHASVHNSAYATALPLALPIGIHLLRALLHWADVVVNLQRASHPALLGCGIRLETGKQ